MKGADSVRVYLADNENAAYKDAGTKDLSGAEGLKITCSGHDLTVRFDDLKKAVPSFRADERIIVTYDCVMNGNAVCGSKGNENRATLSFSNDPNEGGKGRVDTTPQEKTCSLRQIAATIRSRWAALYLSFTGSAAVLPSTPLEKTAVSSI